MYGDFFFTWKSKTRKNIKLGNRWISLWKFEKLYIIRRFYLIIKLLVSPKTNLGSRLPYCDFWSALSRSACGSKLMSLNGHWSNLLIQLDPNFYLLDSILINAVIFFGKYTDIQNKISWKKYMFDSSKFIRKLLN